MERWYAVHTKVYQERRVATALARYEIETFLPLLADHDRQRTDQVAFFPGYFFMRVDFRRANPALWRWTPGFRYVVSAGEQPIPISDEVIAMVAHHLKNQAEAGSHSRRELTFVQGDLVRIKHGPFRDMVGIFDGPNDPSQRVRVLLEAMQKSMRVRLSPDDLERADTATKQKGDKRPRRSRGRGRPIRSRS